MPVSSFTEFCTESRADRTRRLGKMNTDELMKETCEKPKHLRDEVADWVAKKIAEIDAMPKYSEEAMQLWRNQKYMCYGLTRENDVETLLTAACSLGSTQMWFSSAAKATRKQLIDSMTPFSDANVS